MAKNERSGASAKKRGRRRIWPWLLGAFVLVAIGVAAAGALLYKQALSVRKDLTTVKSDLGQMRESLKSNDAASVKRESDDIRAHSASADKAVHGALWGIGASLPFEGDNIGAVKQATIATNTLAQNALPSVVQLADTLRPGSFKVAGGGINLTPFEQAIPLLPKIDSAFVTAKSQVAGVNRNNLDPQIDKAVGEVVSAINQATPTLNALRTDLPTILQMAGATGQRTYLVVFQTNAEIRATGGNPANVAVMKINKGHMSLANAGEIGIKNGDYYDGASPAMMSLYEPDTYRLAQNFTRNPDFPETGKAFQSMYSRLGGGHVDGVLAVDPVAIGHLLDVTGPIILSDGTTLNSGNAAKYLMADVYQKYSASGPSNAYFSGITGAMVEKLSAGGWDPVAMFKSLHQDTSEQRLYTWMSNASEEKIIDHYSSLVGALASSNDKGTQFGIYLNNSEYSKLNYYLDTSVKLSCDSSARTIKETITEHSSVPTSGLTTYQLGIRPKYIKGMPRTTMFLDTFAFAVPGGSLTMEPSSGDFPEWNRQGTQNGRQGKSVTMRLDAGQTKSVTATSTVPKDAKGPLQIRYSPTAHDTPVDIDSSCDSMFPSK